MKQEIEIQQRKQNQKLIGRGKKHDKFLGILVRTITEITQIINSRDGIKDINTDIKKIIRKYNNFMPINLTTWMKWVNFLIDKNY